MGSRRTFLSFLAGNKPTKRSDISVASIMAKIQRMGHEYQPGNASKPGYLYSPLPFPEFKDTPYQRGAVPERFFLLSHSLPRPFTKQKKLLDIGCHTGYNCFRFQELGYECTGMDSDELTIEIAQDVSELKQTGIKFINAKVGMESLKRLGKFDIVLFLSTFQWVVQLCGYEKAKEILFFIQSQCDVMFFETSMGMEGKMKLPQLPDKDAVQALLLESGHHKTVDNLGPIASPGKLGAPPRYVFRCQKAQVPYVHPNNALPPHAMHKLMGQLKNVPPLYQKEKEHFISKVYKISVNQGMPVALKIVKSKKDQAGQFLFREHEFLRCLDSEQFPRYFAHGIYKEHYFLVSTWVDGTSMKDVMKSLKDRGQALHPQLDKISKSLKEKNIYHRDIWEKNFLVNNGKLTLLDFGWSCWADEFSAAFVAQGLREADDDVAVQKLKDQLSGI